MRGLEDLSSKYDGIVVVGGDGFLHEVLNGLSSRRDGSLQRLKIGVVHWIGDGFVELTLVVWQVIPAGSTGAILMLIHILVSLTRAFVSFRCCCKQIQSS